MSLVGRNIRGILHQLGEAFELFAEQQIYLVSQAANDLNFTFVVDETQGDRLVDQLHELLIRARLATGCSGPTWEQLFAPHGAGGRAPRASWWRDAAQARAAARAIAGANCGLSSTTCERWCARRGAEARASRWRACCTR